MDRSGFVICIREHNMNNYSISLVDYGVIGFYAVFLLSLGFIFKKFSKDSGDFFRGGGRLQWWMCGASAFMVTFSAWTFTGAAGKIYNTGTLVLGLYYANVIGFIISYFFTSYRIRQLRVVTYAEAIRARYGPANEQFYAWTQVPVSVVFGAIWLNAVAIFVSSVFGLGLTETILVVGMIVIANSVMGGAWAVVASDFVQMLVVVTITIVAAALALLHPKVGGVTGLLEQIPSSHMDWTELARPKFIVFWVCALVITQTSLINNMAEGGSRFLMVRDSKHARKAVLIPLFCMLVFPAIWIIPSMAATITNPNIAADFPHLTRPEEAAYVAISMQTMPKGLLGLLICGIFAATLSSMDSGLNRSAGIFLRNLYKPLINPHASEKNLLIVGRIATFALGTVMLGAALLMSKFREADLFGVVVGFLGAFNLPLAIPMLYGLFFRRVPSWTGWSTALIGLTIGLFFQFAKPDISFVSEWFYGVAEINSREIADANYFVKVFIIFSTCTIYYFSTSLFYSKTSKHFKAKVDNFFKQVNKPVDQPNEETGESDSSQFRTIGMICYVYGSFICLLALIPNPVQGRLSFLFCGGFVLGVGFLLKKAASKISASKNHSITK